MAIIYEVDDVVIDKYNDAVYAGYKGSWRFPIHSLIILDEKFDDGAKWDLTYKKGTDICRWFRFESDKEVWVGDMLYTYKGNGCYTAPSDDPEEEDDVICEVYLEKIDENGKLLEKFFMGFTDPEGLKKNVFDGVDEAMAKTEK